MQAQHKSNPQASLPTRKTALDCRLCGACNVIQPPQVCCHAIALCWGFHLKSYAKSLNRLRQQRIQVITCSSQRCEQMHFLKCCNVQVVWLGRFLNMYTRRMHLSSAVCQPKFALANAGNFFTMLFSYLPSNQSSLIAPRQAGSDAYAPAMLLFGTHGCKSRPEHAETT